MKEQYRVTVEGTAVIEWKVNGQLNERRVTDRTLTIEGKPTVITDGPAAVSVELAALTNPPD